MSWTKEIPTEEGWYLVYTGFNEKPFLRYFRCGKVFEDWNCFVPTRSSPQSYKAWLRVPKKLEDDVTQESHGYAYFVLRTDLTQDEYYKEFAPKDHAAMLAHIANSLENGCKVLVIKGTELKVKTKVVVECVE